jgi:5'-AMP-activated protein kinase catalytic alpha subunit
MLSGNKYNGLNVDIWSSGIVLYAMICGQLPFEDKDNTILYKKIKQGIFKIPEFISDNAKDFLHRILNIDPEKRYNIEQIKLHPWFNIINPKIYMSRGLLLNIYIIPIDEDIIDKMVNEYEYNGIEVMINLLANKHNHLTTTYYLLLEKKIRKGGKSVCNTCSSEFLKYINNPGNLLSNYNGNWKKLFKDRAKDKYNKIQDNINEIKKKEDVKETKQEIVSMANQNNNNKDLYVNKNEDINIKKNINESLKQDNNNNQSNNNTFNINDEINAKDNIINNNVDYSNNNENVKIIIKDKKNIEKKKKQNSIFEN